MIVKKLKPQKYVSSSSALYKEPVASIDDAIRRVNGQKFVHEHLLFYMYMKKPLQNRMLLRIGYCFDLGALAVISKHNSGVIQVFAPVNPVKATTVDLLAANTLTKVNKAEAMSKQQLLTDASNKAFSELFKGLGVPQEFPVQYGVPVPYVAFASEVQLIFMETDDFL